MTAANMKPSQRADWLAALQSLPPYKGHGKDSIPSFFFPHGHPGWVAPSDQGRFSGDMGPNSRSVHFLKDFGHFLLERYNPKAILVFSAHWESDGETLVSNWGEQRNPLYYDYYGFPKQMFTEIGFKSRGDDALSKTVVSAIQQAGLKARLSGPEEKRGRDGLGQLSTGLDHGVFVPLSLMFPGHGLANPGDTQFDIPVIQASINGSLTAEDNEALGKAVSALRSEGVLVLSGGLTVHTFEDFSAFTESGAKEIYKQWDQAIVDAVNLPQSSQERHKALRALLNHPGCKLAHPRLEHFIPLYVAAGAGNVATGEARVISGIYGSTGVAFW